MNVHSVEGGNDEPLEHVDAHRVAKKLLSVFAVRGPCYLVVWEALKPCGFRCRDPSSSGSEPVALCFGECECWGFGAWSWVFEGNFREVFSDGPISFGVFLSGPYLSFVDLLASRL